MATTKQSVIARDTMAEDKSGGISAWFNRQAEKFEKDRFAWMAILLTFQSCLGSVAAFYLLGEGADIITLGACAIVTMLCNAVFLAQATAKWTLAILYLSILLNTILMLIYI